MGEFLAQFAAHKLAGGGGENKAPDQSQPADPAAALSASMAQPGFSAGSGVPDPTQQNAMAHPASSFMSTLANIQGAPHQWGQDMRSGALSALAKIFS